jgi:hypothetical protein
MSPGSIVAATWSTTAPVTPAGTITQAARGGLSFATMSSIDEDDTAPSDSSCATASGLTSETTTSCPSRISLRVRLAPMRPSPTMPSCIACPFT